MPVTNVVTSKSKDRVTALTLNSEQKAKLYTLIEAFLLFNPKPTDEQVHQLAKSVGMDQEELERVVYEFFAEVLTTEVDEGEDVVDHTPLAGEDHLRPTQVVEDDSDSLILESHFDNSINLKASDEAGDAAGGDGQPDAELQGDPDPLKEASETDGAPDVEQVKRKLQQQDQSHA